LSERRFCDSWGDCAADEKVYKQRWNQVGGPEILTTENHDGQGCNVVFNDSHVEFVKTDKLGELRWKVNESKNLQ